MLVRCDDPLLNPSWTHLSFRDYLGVLQQVEYADAEFSHQAIGYFWLESPSSLQHVMKLRLRDPQNSCKASLCDISFLYAVVYKNNKSRPKSLKGYACAE